MNKTHRTIQYRLHPRSVAKTAMLWGTAGACRFVWNHFVARLRDDYAKLDQCLGYKSNVVKVPAAYTSQKCRACGHTAKQNRKTQSDFHCVKCGHRANADINAALNILASGNGAAGRGGGGITRPVKRQIEQKFPVDFCI